MIKIIVYGAKHPILQNLDMTIKDPVERIKLVEQLLKEFDIEEISDKIRSAVLERLSNYIVFAAIKKEKEETQQKVRTVLTPSRMETIEKREISMQHLQETAEYEEVIETHINEDKNTILDKKAKYKITDLDKMTIPFLNQIDESISNIRNKLNNNVMSLKDTNKLRQIVIELERDKYIIKEAYKKPVKTTKFIQSKTIKNYDGDTGYYFINNKGEEEYKLVSEHFLDFNNYKVISGMIKNYTSLKQNSEEDLNGDMKYIIMVFEDLLDKRFKYEFPVFFDMVKWKIDKISNTRIKMLLEEKYEINHTSTYISTLLCQVIPKLLVTEYKRQWILWIYNNKPRFYMDWKTCSCCNKIKPRINFFWTKNSSLDGFYSKCKDCRNINSRSSQQQLIKIKDGFNENECINRIIQEDIEE